MIDPAALPGHLAARLHDPETPHDELPIGGFKPGHDRWHPRPAAVLLPILLDPEPSVLLTVRSRQMSLHAGQIALPGGRREGDEAFPLTTAVRETREEIGVSDERMIVHGLLDRFDTLTGYRIVPVVASIEGRPELIACPREVEEIFSVPLSQLLDPGAYRHHRVTRGGHAHDLVTLPHANRLIWGATAAILHHFCQKLS